MSDNRSKRSGLIDYLSGGNHELFHTNVLAFIAKNFKNEFLKIFNLEGKIKDYDASQVYTESDHFDLSIKNNAGEYIFVLENKMKSFPTIKQLERYREKVSNKNITKSKSCVFILLSLVKQDERRLKGWQSIDYLELAENIRKSGILTNKDIKNLLSAREQNYFFNFLDDYILYIEKLGSDLEVDKIKDRITNKTFSIFSELKDKFKHSEESTEDSKDTAEHKWKFLMRRRLLFDAIKEKIISGVKDPNFILAGCGVVRGEPFIEFTMSFKDGKLIPYDSINKDDDEDTTYKYWIQIYENHIEHGFSLYFDDDHGIEQKNTDESHKVKSDYTKKPNKDKRLNFIESVWAKCKTVPVLETIATHFPEKDFCINCFLPITTNNKYRAYLYDHRAMVYFLSEIDSPEKISTFIESTTKHINHLLETFEKESIDTKET